MAVEIANLVHAMVVFTAADPPVIIDRDGVRSVTRTDAGTFLVELDEKLPYTQPIVSPGANVQVQSTGPAATFAAAFIEPTGDVLVQERNLAGNLSDNSARVSLVIFRFPTKS